MIEFSNKILFVGYGAVAECTLPILFKHIKVAPQNVTVIDFEAKEEKLAEWTKIGVRFVRDKVTEENMHALLGKHLAAGDILEGARNASMHAHRIGIQRLGVAEAGQCGAIGAQ